MNSNDSDKSNVLQFKIKNATLTSKNTTVKSKTSKVIADTVNLTTKKVYSQLPLADGTPTRITAGHRGELTKLVQSLVRLEMTANPYAVKGKLFKKYWTIVFREAVSAPDYKTDVEITLDGFPDCDFERAKKRLTTLKNILSNTSENIVESNYLKHICHIKKDEFIARGIVTEQGRRDFQAAVYFTDSMTYMTLVDLRDYKAYLDDPDSTFDADQYFLNKYMGSLTKEEQAERIELLTECEELLVKLDVDKKKLWIYLSNKYKKGLIERLHIEELKEFYEYASQYHPTFDHSEDLLAENQQAAEETTSNILKKLSKSSAKPAKSSKPNVIPIFKKSDKSEINKLADALINELGAVPRLEDLCTDNEKKGYLKIQSRTARKRFHNGEYPFAYKENESRESPILINVSAFAEYLYSKSQK